MDGPDSDGDGAPDAFESAFGGDAGRYDGACTPWTESVLPVTGLVFPVDVDDDGDGDLLGSTADLTLAVWRNDGDHFVRDRRPLWRAWESDGEGGSSPALLAGILEGDLDGDGEADLVAAAAGRDAGTVWLGRLGGGAFTRPRWLGTDTPTGLGDLDRDGDVDVVTRQGWVENRGRPAFTPRPPVIEGATDGVSDVDGDGDTDLLTHTASSFGWAEHADDGSWTTHLVAATRPTAVVAFDAGADGDLELVAVDDGDVVFVEVDGGDLREPRRLARSWTAPIVADLDADGIGDAFASADGVVRWLRAADPEPTVRGLFSSTPEPWGPPLPGDVDGDGAIDLLLGTLHRSPLADDTDGDGLGDDVERCAIGTDPSASDTDGDGARDGDEVCASTDPSAPE